MLKNKNFIIFLFSFILLLFIFLGASANTVEASIAFEDVDSNTTFYNVPNFPSHKHPNDFTYTHRFIVMSEDKFYLYDCVKINRIEFNTFTGDKYSFSLYGNPRILVEVFTCPVSDISSGWTYLKFGDAYTSPMSVTLSSTNFKIIYSSVDIYDFKNKDEVFFHKTPTSMGVKLAQATQVQELLPMVNKIVTILIPVGLVIFSVRLIVSLLASKKWRRS